jgi:hypothetical protein
VANLATVHQIRRLQLLVAVGSILATASVSSRSAVASPLPGQIAVDPSNPSWFVRSGIGPFFTCGPGDPEGFLCIYLMAVRSHGGDGSSRENPFVDHDPDAGINPAVLDQWETWFVAMDDAGIVVFFIFYDDSAIVWDTGDSVGSEENEFLTTIVDRFEHHAHLIWCVAEEYQEAYSVERVANIATVIRGADDHDHPIAVHQWSGTTFHFPDEPDIDQFAMQLGAASASSLHESIVDAWSTAAGRYQLNMAELVADDPRDVRRRKVWACAMGGAYVMVISMDLATVAPEELEDCGRLVSFLESTNLGELAPHDELAHGGTDYVLASPGESYVAYAANLSGDVGLENMTAGSYTLRWFECATGITVVQGPVAVGTGNQTFPKPTGFDSELVVFIERHDPTSAGANVEPSTWTRIKAAYRTR